MRLLLLANSLESYGMNVLQLMVGCCWAVLQCMLSGDAALQGPGSYGMYTKGNRLLMDMVQTERS